MTDELKCPHCGKPVPDGSPLGVCPQCLLKIAAGPSLHTYPQATAGETQTGRESGLQHPTLDQLAPHFPQLEILEFVARGGMGAVYKARQPNLDRLVALKILLLPATSDAGFADRFKREARSLARLNHPNILAVYDFGQAGGFCFLMMEYVDGVNLRQIEQAGEFTPREALQIIPQICEALQFAHDEGIVHRDIKPENILINKKGRVKIADFGLAKLLGPERPTQHITHSNIVMGTPHYMAPEQIEHPLEVDHRADIYSLGVVFYEMLTGELPLGRFASPSQKVRIDVRLDEVVLRTLEKEPALRYQQASQVKTALETIAAGKAPEPPPPVGDAGQTPPPAQENPPVKSHGLLMRVWTWAILFLLTAIFAETVLKTNETTTEPAAVPRTSDPSMPGPQNPPVSNTPPTPTPANGSPPTAQNPAPISAPSDTPAISPVTAPTVAAGGSDTAAPPATNPSPQPPADVAATPGGELHIISGTGDFASVTTTTKTLNVLPGAKLSGKIKLSAINLGPANAIAPLIYTPSWGERSRNWHTIQSSLPTGPSDQEAQISLTAPTVPGAYNLVFAFQWQIDGDYVASATNWSLGSSRWDNGNDLTSLDAQQVIEAQTTGATMINWLMQANPPTYTLERTPVDVLTVIVTGPDRAATVNH